MVIHSFFGTPGYAHEQSDSEAVCGKGAASVRYERKRHALCRDQPEHNSHIEQSLEGEQHCKAKRKHASEKVRRIFRNLQAGTEKKEEKQTRQDYADKSQFLSDHGQDEVGVGFR